MLAQQAFYRLSQLHSPLADTLSTSLRQVARADTNLQKMKISMTILSSAKRETNFPPHSFLPAYPIEFCVSLQHMQIYKNINKPLASFESEYPLQLLLGLIFWESVSSPDLPLTLYDIVGGALEHLSGPPVSTPLNAGIAECSITPGFV